MGNNLSSRLFPMLCICITARSQWFIFLFFFILIFSNSFGPLDRGTFPAVPAR